MCSISFPAYSWYQVPYPFLRPDSQQLKQFDDNYNNPTDYSYYLQLFPGYHVPIPPILWYTTGKRGSAISGPAPSFPAYLLSHSRILIINVTIAMETLIMSKGLTFEAFLCLGRYFLERFCLTISPPYNYMIHLLRCIVNDFQAFFVKNIKKQGLLPCFLITFYNCSICIHADPDTPAAVPNSRRTRCMPCLAAYSTLRVHST